VSWDEILGFSVEWLKTTFTFFFSTFPWKYNNVKIIFLKVKDVAKEKKTTTSIKPDILLLHVPPRNGGDDDVGIKRPSWKPKVGCQTSPYAPSKNHKKTTRDSFCRLNNILFIVKLYNTKKNKWKGQKNLWPKGKENFHPRVLWELYYANKIKGQN